MSGVYDNDKLTWKEILLAIIIAIIIVYPMIQIMRGA